MCRVGVQSAMDAYQRLTTLAALRTQTKAANEYMYVVRTTLAPHPRATCRTLSLSTVLQKSNTTPIADDMAWVQMLLECTRSAGGQYC